MHLVDVMRDDDDVVWRNALLDQSGHRSATLDAVPDDDGVSLHALPPTLGAVLITAALREDLDGRAHEHDEEQEAQRRDDEDVGQPCLLGDRDDVAVARRRERDGGVVERVEPTDRSAVAVAIAGALDIDEHRRDR